MRKNTFYRERLSDIKSIFLSRKKQFKLWFNRHVASKKVHSVKLVAIAKNESMYLPEWIFHHLYFGFSEIEIYYNGCDDNTHELSLLMKDYPVKFINSDNIFTSGIPAPQVHIYRSCFEVQTTADAIMFLDIDEFWVPVGLHKTISEVCKDVGNFDSLSFQWFNKLEKDSLFTSALQQEIKVESARQIKTLYKAYLRPQQMNPHNTLDRGLLQKFEDAKTLKCLNTQNSQVDSSSIPLNGYILHRKNRSQYEYIAMLLRGRPLANQDATVFELKNNRTGFYNVSNPITFNYNTTSYADYRKFMDKHLQHEKFTDYFKTAKEHVDSRYSQVVKIVEENYLTNKQGFERLLAGVDLSEIETIRNRQ